MINYIIINMEEKENDINKIAGYVRVSSKKQREEGRHRKQRKRLTSWAEDRNLEIDLYEDIAESGQSDERKDYNRMMSQIEEYDALLVRELSRMGRNLQKILNDIEELENKNVEFISLKESFNTSTAHGRLLFQLVGAINEFYANLRREETLRRIERKKEQDKNWGRKKKLSDEEVEQCEEWRESGLSYQDISLMVELEYNKEIDKSTIYRYLNPEED